MKAISAKPLPEPEWGDGKYIHTGFGLTLSCLHSLRKKGRIRSMSTKGPGEKYGKRLYPVGSVRAYLEAQEALELEQCAQGGAH